MTRIPLSDEVPEFDGDLTDDEREYLEDFELGLDDEFDTIEDDELDTDIDADLGETTNDD